MAAAAMWLVCLTVCEELSHREEKVNQGPLWGTLGERGGTAPKPASEPLAFLYQET